MISHHILAFYHIVTIENPAAEVKLQQDFCRDKDIKGRVYISSNGINAQMSGSVEDAAKYMEWMKSRPLFNDVYFKIHNYHEHVFPRTTFKVKKSLVAADEMIDLANRGDHISPAKWREFLESKEKNYKLLDIRNNYEWEVGRFVGSECPPCENFREFEKYADTLAQELDKEEVPVLMSCTGGIRCELFSALLKRKGFKKVYQLDGGVINYGLKEGDACFEGKLFVFDDRLAIPITDKPASSIVGKCHHCAKPADNYYNCANMDCNELFLCCPDCLKEFEGCCEGDCKEAPRRRPYHQQNAHKPFRKWYHFANQKSDLTHLNKAISN